MTITYEQTGRSTNTNNLGMREMQARVYEKRNVEYLRAETMEQMREGIDTLLNKSTTRPVLLEVITDVAADEREQERYSKYIL